MKWARSPVRLQGVMTRCASAARSCRRTEHESSLNEGRGRSVASHHARRRCTDFPSAGRAGALRCATNPRPSPSALPPNRPAAVRSRRGPQRSRASREHRRASPDAAGRSRARRGASLGRGPGGPGFRGGSDGARAPARHQVVLPRLSATCNVAGATGARSAWVVGVGMVHPIRRCRRCYPDGSRSATAKDAYIVS